MVILESALIETSTCGMIKSKIGHIIEDLDNVRNANWCLYTMYVLKLEWKTGLKRRRMLLQDHFPYDRITQAKRSVPRTFPLKKGWTSEHLQAREDEEIAAGIFGLGHIKKKYVCNLEQQQVPEEQILDVDDSGVGSSQNILPKDFVMNVLKYIKQMNQWMTNLVRALKEAPSHIKTNHLFGMVCDIARCAVGSQTTSVESVGNKFLHLSQSLHQDKPDAIDHWKKVCDSILIAEKEKEALENLTDFPTFKLGDSFDKLTLDYSYSLGTNIVELIYKQDEEEINRENFRTSPVCDLISTAVLGSEQTTSPSLLSHEVNASKDANTLASPNQKDSVPNDTTGKTAPTTEAPAHINIDASQDVVGSENKGSESEIQKDLEHALQLNDACVYDCDFAWATKELFLSLKPHVEIKAGVINAWASHLSIREKERSTTSLSRIFMTISPCVFFPVCANNHYYLVVFWMKKNTIEIIDNSKPPKDMDPLEKYGIDIGLMKDMFEAYFIQKNLLDISENINKSALNVLPLELATSTNKKDCGLYLMRHMETYVGKKGSEWVIGFSSRSINILQVLRGRYCYTLIASCYNNQRLPMLQLANEWIEANMDKMLGLNDKYKKLFNRRNKK
ncbi:hypothetical protein SASPL_152454 [Salvia splendens]|uniref:Ubiquitin-like protease family profile domain-containing protein n=1 Tax=Salvia splendens TaxID=180675 RepID=A0A8X8Z024_SALSN|nr:hypothetical protein SASPL_152454 [Salvia splendens]